MTEKEKTYYARMFEKVLDEHLPRLAKIKERDERRAEVLQALQLLPLVECVNDLDRRLRKLEGE